MGFVSSDGPCMAEMGQCTGGWRGTSTSRTLWEKNRVSTIPINYACSRGESGESKAGVRKESTYIENVILQPSQISSFHHPRPVSLFSSEKKMRVGFRVSQAIPPRLFASAGSAANNSSLP
jgi:hypothetical protein